MYRRSRRLKAISRSLLITAVVVIIVVAAIIAYLALPPTKTTTSPTTSVTSTTTTTTTTTSPSAKTLKLWIQAYASSIDRQKWEQVYKEFEEKTGIKVQVSEFSAADLVAKFTAVLESGVPETYPDLYAWATTFNVMWASKGQLEPLDDIVDWLYKNWGNDIVDQNFQMCKWIGPDGNRRYYAVSVGFVTQSLFVRQDILEKAGLTLDDLSTFDRFNRSLYILRDKLKEMNLNMFPLDIQVSAVAPTDGTYDYWLIWRLFSGVEPVDASGKIYVNDTQAHFDAHAKATALLSKWYKDGIISKAALTEAEVDNNVNFLTGRSVMTPNGVASIYVQAKAQHPEWKIAVIPLPENPASGASKTVITEIRPYLIPAGLPSSRLENAKAFLKFILNRTNYEKWFGTQGGFGWLDAPFYKSLLDKEPYLTDPVWKGVRDGVLHGTMDPATIRPSFSQLHARSFFMLTASKVMLDVMTPQEAAQAIVKEIYSAVASYDKGFKA
jgi:ABC-type glycerol-3-phosphate transport system substrate-binding protein